MKSSLKFLVAGISTIGLGLAAALPSVAQTPEIPNAQTTPATPAPTNRPTGVPPIGGASEGQLTPSNTTPDNTTPGNTTPDNTTPIKTSPNDTPPSNMSPNQMSPNQMSPNQMPNQMSPGSSDGSSPQIVPNNPTQRGNTAPGTQPIVNNSPDYSFAGSEGKTISQVVRSSPNFELFNALLQVADSNSHGAFSAQLADGNHTVFAPTDAALAAIPPATFKALVQPENRALLAQLLNAHIVSGKMTSAELSAKEVRSMDGSTMMAQGSAGNLMIGNAQVVGPDIMVSNGIIHAVNQVIIPADLQAKITSLTSQAAAPMTAPMR
ncbi:MAG TPA: fasciclin domain-containing protein [Leptolyngbya sp.]|nr:fasciclin domain-containing protein [Leptolyngbya sp.]